MSLSPLAGRARSEQRRAMPSSPSRCPCRENPLGRCGTGQSINPAAARRCGLAPSSRASSHSSLYCGAGAADARVAPERRRFGCLAVRIRAAAFDRHSPTLGTRSRRTAPRVYRRSVVHVTGGNSTLHTCQSAFMSGRRWTVESRRGAVAEGTALLLSTVLSPFPGRVTGPACALASSRLTQRSLARRPAHSHCPQFVARMSAGFRRIFRRQTLPICKYKRSTLESATIGGRNAGSRRQVLLLIPHHSDQKLRRGIDEVTAQIFRLCNQASHVCAVDEVRDLSRGPVGIAGANFGHDRPEPVPQLLLVAPPDPITRPG